MGLNNKGFFFTIDALLAASILLGGLIIISSHYVDNQPAAHLNYLSQDIINSLDELKINELNNSYVDELINNSNITNINNSLLQQIGEFWAEEKYSIAEQFMDNVTRDIIPDIYGFGIWINDDLIYQRDNPPPSSRSGAKKLITGIEKKKPIDGYISKARANNFMKTGTKIVSFSPEGAGWDGDWDDPGEAVIDKYFEIPNSMNITGADFYVSLHIEDDGPDWEVININNGACIINRDEIYFLGGEGTFDVIDIDECLNNGENQVRLRLRNIGYNGHVHPGMLIKINYTMNESTPSYNNSYFKRYYFDNVISNEGSDEESGAWASLPFYIPEDATDVEVNMHITAQNIRDYTGWGWFYAWDGWRRARNYDYMLFINEDNPFDYDGSPSVNMVYDYDSSELDSEVVEGTNVVSVYLNNYADYEWGGGQPEIYSDPFNDADNSSYIDVSYNLPETAPYGSIKVNQIDEFGGNADWEKEISFSFPEEATDMGNVFTHIVQQYSYIVDVEADIYTPPSNLVFTSPSSRAVPTSVYIPGDVLSLSPIANNYVRISDRNWNDILPESSVEYNFYIPSFVGYGNVFSTQQEAEDDAISRLNDTLGNFISADNIIVESSEMKDVPTMWGPAVMEVRVWH